MTKKGVYPHDYKNSFEKFNETLFPNREDFFSLLNNEHISDEDYHMNMLKICGRVYLN